MERNSIFLEQDGPTLLLNLWVHIPESYLLSPGKEVLSDFSHGHWVTHMGEYYKSRGRYSISFWRNNYN